MKEQPLVDVVSRQYERWAYPEPIDDLERWLRNNWEHYDPSISHWIFWPDRDYVPNLDILIAGCGTNQAAVFAFNNPSARVVAIDISQSSLAHEQYLKDKHGLSNLELHRLPIEEVSTLGREFDLIVSTGVLHHMAEPLMGMKALGSCLRRDGVLAIMLYAKYGRVGVEALQSVFRDLRLRQEEASLNLVKETLQLLSPQHLVQPYFPIAPDLKFDTGLVDTFLHGRERSYSVEDCIELVRGASLVFQGWLDNSCYYPEITMPESCALYAAVNRLPEPEIWSVMERLNTQNACHNFIACHADRPKHQYTIDFSSPRFLEYVPVPRHMFRIEGGDLVRMAVRIPVTDAQLAFVRYTDGRRTIKDIAVHVVAEGMLEGDAHEFERFARELFQSLWRLGFMAFALNHESEAGL